MTAANQSIYIADDERDTLDLISRFLEREGYQVRAFTDGESMLTVCEEAVPDLVVLDIMMPGMDGFSVCSELRRRYPNLLIIIISAKDGAYDRVTGLSLGCDDYIVKPFLPLELVIRARALLKHRQAANEEPEAEPAGELSFGPLTLFPGPRTAQLAGEPFALTPSEFDFLALLIRQGGSAVSREELLNTIWQVNWEANTRVTDDLVKRLRRKFRMAESPIRIETVWGYGFRIALGESGS